MPFVSITRLRVRSIAYMPAFYWRTAATIRQVKRAEGFLHGALLADRRRTFWTMTVWTDARAMSAYMAGGAHLRAMPRLMDWCDEASVVHWTQTGSTPPDWITADRRMRAEGRPSELRHPAPGHAALDYAPPRTTRTVPIEPARQ